MKAVLGIASLLVVLAIAGIVAKKQLQVVGPAPSSGMPAASTALTGQPISQEQAQALPKQVKQDVEKALQQGAERASEASP